MATPGAGVVGGAGHAPAVICFPFAGGVMGGSHISALKLIETLDPRDYKPLIVLHSDEGQFAEFLHEHGFSFERAPMQAHIAPGSRLGELRRLASAPATFWRLARFLKDRNVRIVHTNEGPMHATWGVPAKLAGAKQLWHHRANPLARSLRYLAPFTADQVVSVSAFASPRPALISASGRNAVVHSPFDTLSCKADRAACRADALAELGLGGDTRLLGYFGNFVDRKRPLLFVEAIAALVAKAPEMPVAGLMFGSPLEPGLDEAVAERARQLGIADHIRIMGFRHPSNPWMAACDVLMVTAVEEPFGRTLIEAMLLKTPVVAARSGGNIEAIREGETGLLVPQDDAEAFALVTLELLRDPAMSRRIAETAQSDALGRFGIKRHHDSITAIYRRLLSCAD